MLIFSVSFQIDQMPEGKERKEEKRECKREGGRTGIYSGCRLVRAHCPVDRGAVALVDTKCYRWAVARDGGSGP